MLDNPFINFEPFSVSPVFVKKPPSTLQSGQQKPGAKKVHILTGGSAEPSPEPSKPPLSSFVVPTSAPEPEPTVRTTTIELDALRAAPVAKNTVTLDRDREGAADGASGQKLQSASLVGQLDMHKYGKIQHYHIKNCL